MKSNIKRKNKTGAGRPETEAIKKLLPQIKKLYATKPYNEVAAELGIGEYTVRNACTKYKLKKSAYHWDRPWEELVLKMWENHSPIEIAEKLKLKFGAEKTKWAVINKYRELAKLR